MQIFFSPFQVIGQLERGTVISKFYARKRPERKMLAVRRETMLVVWYRVSSSRNMYEVSKTRIRLNHIKRPIIKIKSTNLCEGAKSITNSAFIFQGAVDVREIKEIRAGKSSRDFSRWSEEANNARANRCFVVFYGSDFNLKVRSGDLLNM